MRRSIVFVGAFLLLILGVPVVRAAEESVPLDKIPKAVTDSLLSKFPKAKIDKCTREKQGGDVVYDIEFKQESGRKGESDIKENGVYVNYEKEVDAKDLPKAVRAAIEKKYPKSTLKEVMEETEVNGKEEKLFAYEANLLTAEKKEVEVRVSPEGKILEDGGEKESAAKQ